MGKYNKTIIAPIRKSKRRNTKLYVALIAYNEEKAEMLSFVKENENFFEEYKIIATNAPGKLINEHNNLSVVQILSGPLGGIYKSEV